MLGRWLLIGWMPNVTPEQLDRELLAIFRLVLDDDRLVLSSDLAPGQIPGWDSLAHVNILVSIEEELNVAFSSREMGALRTMGEIRESVLSKLASGLA